jgi:Lon-like protease
VTDHADRPTDHADHADHADRADAPTARSRPELVTRLWRSSFYAGSAAILAWSSLVVPLPFIEQVPGRPTPIPPLIQIEGVETTELIGETSLLTVLLRQQPTLPALGALLDGDRDLLRVDGVYPPGVDRQEYLTAERERFGRQFEVAAAVGAEAAGVEIELITEAVVVTVIFGSPAEGVLTPGDAVVAVDGTPIASGEELQAITRASEPGDRITLSVRHEGELRDVEVTLEEVGEDGQARLGVGIETAVDELRLPFDVQLARETRIGGPSAGMMVGITVYDLLAEEDLLSGRNVMGTGTLAGDGTVGPVGGVPQKMLAAADAGADIVLVPSLQLEEALAAAPEGLDVIGVADLAEALAVLRGDA